MVYNTGACYRGYATIGENACQGWSVCADIASHVNIKDGSCIGQGGKSVNSSTLLIF